MVKVNFIAEKDDEGQISSLERSLDQLHPVLQILERLLICNIVDENDLLKRIEQKLEELLLPDPLVESLCAETYCICFKDIGCDHFTEDALASDIPHLHGDLHVVGQF